METIESLQADRRAALLAGTDASAIRSRLAGLEHAQRVTAEAGIRSAADVKSAESAAIHREAMARAASAARHLQNLLSQLAA